MRVAEDGQGLTLEWMVRADDRDVLREIVEVGSV